MPASKTAPKKADNKPVAKGATNKPAIKAVTKKAEPAVKETKMVANTTTAKKAPTPVVAKATAKKEAAPAKAKTVAPKAKAPETNTPPKKAPATAKAAAHKQEPVVAKVTTAKKTVAAKPAQTPVKNVKEILTPPTPPVMPAKKKEETKAAKIVVPKTSVKTAVKYEPDFMKSVLDADPQPEESIQPTMRYSDNDLVEFRELINRKLEAAKKELSYLQGLITRKDDMGGDNDDARYMTMEDGSLSMEREQLSQMASRQITFVDHLEKALMRIESKTYGVCRVTGKLIDKARLRAVPHATLSVEGKMGKDRR